MNYFIVRTPRGKKFLYQVYCKETGKNIGHRLSARTYVACIVHERVDGVSLMQTWFGRKDLIGKGDSRHYVGKPGMQIAQLRITIE